MYTCCSWASGKDLKHQMIRWNSFSIFYFLNIIFQPSKNLLYSAFCILSIDFNSYCSITFKKKISCHEQIPQSLCHTSVYCVRLLIVDYLGQFVEHGHVELVAQAVQWLSSDQRIGVSSGKILNPKEPSCECMSVPAVISHQCFNVCVKRWMWQIFLRVRWVWRHYRNASV